MLDGGRLHSGEEFCVIRGNGMALAAPLGATLALTRHAARSILVAERVVLNFMQRMSGIATLTATMSAAARPARILETRKTVPGLRVLDKWVRALLTSDCVSGAHRPGRMCRRCSSEAERTTAWASLTW